MQLERKTERSQARCFIAHPVAWVKHQTWLLRVSELANQRFCGDGSLLSRIWTVLAAKLQGHSHSGYLTVQMVEVQPFPAGNGLLLLRNTPLLHKTE